MTSIPPSPIQVHTVEELLGPLNDLEQKHAPERLFVAGDTDILRERARVAIVGSRQATPKGLARARKLALLFCQQDIVVVSGLAQGIDTAAHQTALKHGGRTIAIIGTPLDQVYPKANTALQHRIMGEHLCISQFPVGAAVQRRNFPMRNHTMALISDATVIVEATDTSGSLGQAREALRLGRGLYIMKSVAADLTLSWPNDLLRQGARILSDETLADLLSFLPGRAKADIDGPIPF